MMSNASRGRADSALEPIAGIDVLWLTAGLGYYAYIKEKLSLKNVGELVQHAVQWVSSENGAVTHGHVRPISSQPH